MADAHQPFLAVPSACGHGSRYETRGVLGKGSFGTVYAVHDRDLDRLVAIKVLAPGWAGDPGEVRAFHQEARSAARIEHAAVVPVYDLQGGALPWMVMKHIAGTTLADALEQSPPPASLARPRAVALTLLRACEAIAAAHRLDTIHRDLKPANLLLGAHGEVWVTDWGLATSSRQGGADIHGTPAYMAPEQARGEAPALAWDVYALGAVLFEALYRRPPLGTDISGWWDRRRRGEIDLPSGRRLRPVDPALRSIVARCLEAEPARRYADAGALAADLRAFLGDEPVAAHQDGLAGRLLRQLRRHRRAVLVAAPFVLLAVVLGGMLAVERVKLRARWGAPIATGVGPGWQTLTGGFAAGPDWLTSTGAHGNVHLLTRACEGGLAVAYQATIDPRHPPGDVSIALARGVQRNAAGEATLVDPVYAMVGAWDNTGTRIRLADGTTIAADAYRLEPGRDHQVRIEFLDGRLSIAIDGAIRCAAQVDLPDGPRFVCLYGYYPGKSWRQLRVWERGFAERVPAVAVGDAFLRCEPPDVQRAGLHYARAAGSLAGEAGDEARLRLGMALALGGDHAAAAQAWGGITSPAIADRAWSSGVRIALGGQRADAAWAAWLRIREAGGQPARVAWAALAHHQAGVGADILAERVRIGASLPSSHLVREAQADLLLHLERWEEAVLAAGEVQPQKAAAQLAGGRAGDALADPGTPPSMRMEALLQLGRYQEILIARPAYPAFAAAALIRCGRAGEVVSAAGVDADLRAQAALALGQDEFAARLGGWKRGERGRALLRLGQSGQVLGERPQHGPALLLAGRSAEALALHPSGADLRRTLVARALEERRVPAALGRPNHRDPADLVLCEVVVPALRAAAGDQAARLRLEASARDRSDARALRCAPLAGAVLGGNPGGLAEGDAALGRALAAELADHPGPRRQAWAAWLALPAHRRDPEDDPALLLLARFRAGDQEWSAR